MILTLSCADRPGIVSRVASFLFERGGNILDAQQFGDVETRQFFMRVVFEASDRPVAALREAFAPIGAEFAMTWTIRDPKVRRKVMILASQADHCLSDLIWRWRRGELPMDICAVVSNHPAETYSSIDLSGLPFHHLPVGRDTKLEQESAIWALIQATGAELVVLARYMQILSDGLAAKLEGRCINIHHSFLPGFKGANPYAQAHARGVKLIGATAHFVTKDLDEGPIIEQNVTRVEHSDSKNHLVEIGQDAESKTLTQAVKWFSEHRVLLDGQRTIIFR